MTYATIQFIDSHSESIKDKNLIPIDGQPLWTHNSDLVQFTKNNDSQKRIVGSYICTTYDDNRLWPKNGEKKIPRARFNVDKCPLSDRVKDCANYLNEATIGIDAYILLLGNSRCFCPEALLLAMDAYDKASLLFPEISGLVSVTNYSPFNPKRAMSLYGGGFAKTIVQSKEEPQFSRILRIGHTEGEDRHDAEKDSWFFNGAFMIMNAKNELPRGISENDWMGDYSTPYPYLGKFVYGYRMVPMSAIELDEIWQLPMLESGYTTKAFGMAAKWEEDNDGDDAF